MFSFKRAVFFILTLYLMLVLVNKAWAVTFLENRSYSYMQLSFGYAYNANLRYFITQYDGTKKQNVTKSYTASDVSSYNPAIMLGYYFAVPQIGLETQFGRKSLYLSKINGKPIEFSGQNRSYIDMSYIFFNLRKNLFQIYGVYMFVKAGAGVVTVSAIAQSGTGGETTLDPGFLGGGGLYYKLGRHCDLEAFYSFTGNSGIKQGMTTGGSKSMSLAIQEANLALRYDF